MLPEHTSRRIEELVSKHSGRELAAAAQELTGAYRDRAAGQYQVRLDEVHRHAYLVTRFPATFGAITAALQRMAASLPGNTTPFASILDLGAGPGTATLAATELFSDITHATLVERDPGFVTLSRSLLHDAVFAAEWCTVDLASLRASSLAKCDLAIAAYSLGELDPVVAQAAVAAAWGATNTTLLLIEPGTPRGFETILRARQQLISLGAHVAAPCADNEPCPMEGTTSWCHFPERIQRTKLHRMVKGGELGWEDEKYSYLAVTRQPAAPCSSRIIDEPKALKHEVRMVLCHDGVLDPVAVTSRDDRENFKAARKLRWGDGLR